MHDAFNTCSMPVMQMMNISLTHRAINFNYPMIPRKKAGCSVLKNSDEYLAQCIIQTMHIKHIMHSMHSMHVMQIINLEFIDGLELRMCRFHRWA